MIVIHGGGRHLLWLIVVLINLLWWIVGLPKNGVFRRYAYPFRCELTPVVDCTVSQFPVMDCVFQAYGCLPCDS